MYKLYYILDNQSLPYPHIYLKKNHLDNPYYLQQNNINLIKSFTPSKKVSMNQKVFIVFDKVKQQIIDLYFNENEIPTEMNKYHIYSTNVHNNVFEFFDI